MDREKLLGGYMKEKISKRNQAIHRLQERASNQEIEQKRLNEIRERREKPFKEVSTRNNVVVGVVSELTKDGDFMKLSDDFRKKVIVVIGKHPETDLTPDHVAVCGVTEIKRPNKDGYYRKDATSAEFAFAIVPTSKLDTFVRYPHQLHTPDKPDTILFSPEESLTSEEIQEAADSKNRLFRGIRLRTLEEHVTLAERNLQMVLEAVSDPELNPHLQSLPVDSGTNG